MRHFVVPVNDGILPQKCDSNTGQSCPITREVWAPANAQLMQVHRIV